MTASRSFSFSAFIFSIRSYACCSLASMEIGLREGPALDMSEMDEVGKVGDGEEKAGEMDRNLKNAVV